MRGGDRAGERIPSSPQSEALPEPESLQAILARKSSAQRHLGASSPSGNARGRMAEWCTPCPDEPLAKKYGTRHHVPHLGAAASPFKGEARPSPVSAHSISKRIPPRKRKSMERRKRGEGGRAVLRAGRRFERPRERSARFSTKPPRARRVRSQSEHWVK